MKNSDKILRILKELYQTEAHEMLNQLEVITSRYEKIRGNGWVSEKDCMLITYADTISGEEASPINELHEFLNKYVNRNISAVHLLPFYPFSSDDGFSVIDYRQVNKDIGSWDDIVNLSNDYELMFDAVINHISSKSEWFEKYKNGDDFYKSFFIECDNLQDYSQVVRPRALPLLTEFETKKGKVSIWTTFSADQVDLNFKEPKVILEIMDILLMYVSKGARYIRLDAIGFLWKELGTSCIHLDSTHKIVKLMRLVIEEINENVILITETNTPHKENISYFGNGYDEAHMVYQFPLAPLVLYAFLKEDSSILLKWLKGIENVSDKTTFFNFLASHDGIGLRPVEDILDQTQVDMMVGKVLERGGKVSYRHTGDGGERPYELNINYMDALCKEDIDDDLRIDKFMASQAILLSVIGVPGIYIHSLLGSGNDIEGMLESGISRRINREKLSKNALFEELDNPLELRAKILNRYLNLLRIRKKHAAFSPTAKQNVFFTDKRLFVIRRENAETNEAVDVFINLSKEHVEIKGRGYNLILQEDMTGFYSMAPYEVVWRIN